MVWSVRRRVANDRICALLVPAVAPAVSHGGSPTSRQLEVWYVKKKTSILIGKCTDRFSWPLTSSDYLMEVVVPLPHHTTPLRLCPPDSWAAQPPATAMEEARGARGARALLFFFCDAPAFLAKLKKHALPYIYSSPIRIRTYMNDGPIANYNASSRTRRRSVRLLRTCNEWSNGVQVVRYSRSCDLIGQPIEQARIELARCRVSLACVILAMAIFQIHYLVYLRNLAAILGAVLSVRITSIVQLNLHIFWWETG
jgi:hypothetical protein